MENASAGVNASSMFEIRASPLVSPRAIWLENRQERLFGEGRWTARLILSMVMSSVRVLMVRLHAFLYRIQDAVPHGLDTPKPLTHKRNDATRTLTFAFPPTAA
jgi:hypothetical protein